MTRVLITGMSGVGKSAVVEELRRLGHAAIDLDHPDWSHYRLPHPDGPTAGGDEEWMWQEERVARLLADDDSDVLYLSGCASNQGRFYPQFDHVVLLSAPPEVMGERIETRTDNDFGKDPAEWAKILADKDEFEPMLRSRADSEIDAGRPLSEVVETILGLARG